MTHRQLWYNSNVEASLHNVADMPASARAAVEGLVGHALDDDQQVYVLALDRAWEPPVEQRRDAWDDLQGIIDDMHQSARATGIPVDQAEQIIDEACENVRYGN